MKTPINVAPAQGKLGVLLVGLGAVSTTTIAGVAAIRKGLAQPIGSLTQMGTIRLGKRSDGRSPKIKDFVDLVELASRVIRADPALTSCDRPACARCRDALLGGPKV